MYCLLPLSLLVVLTEACPDADTRKFLEENVVEADVSGLVNGKTVSPVWVRKKYAGLASTVLTKYTSNGHDFTAKVHLIGDDRIIIEEQWKENEKKGTYKVTGEHKKDDGTLSFKTDLNGYVFYAEEHVLGLYACDERTAFWKVIMAVEKDQLTVTAAQESLKRAEDKMKTIIEKLPGSDTDKAMSKLI